LQQRITAKRRARDLAGEQLHRQVQPHLPGFLIMRRHAENISKEGRANLSEDEFGDHETKENCNDFEFFCALSF
jgi:hypothetical protein